MYLKFVLFSILIVGLIDFYFFRSVKALLAEKRQRIRQWVFVAYWLVSILSVLFFLAATYYYIQKVIPPPFLRIYVTGFIFILLVSKCIGCIFLFLYDTIRLFKFIRHKLNPGNNGLSGTRAASGITRKEFLKKSAVLVAGIPFASLLYGMFRTAYDFHVKKVSLQIPDLPPALKGLKIVQISDIHAGSFLHAEPLKQVVEMINNLNADIFFFTGDLVNEVTEEAKPYAAELSKIQVRIGKFSVLGNHDYGDYFYPKDDYENKARNKEEMIALHKEIGWDLLLNENRMLEINGAKLGIVGVENWGSAARFQKYGNLEKACADCHEADVKFLLSHDPSHWDAQIRIEQPDIAVTFSGHTHGMQFGIDIPGIKWSPVKYLYPQWKGLYAEGNQQLYVNPGIGFVGYPGRLGIAPEITLFELS